MSIGALIALGLVAALVLLVLRALSLVPRLPYPVTVPFWCPVSEQTVTVEALYRARDGQPVWIIRCSAFNPPTAIACDKPCLNLQRSPAAGRAVV